MKYRQDIHELCHTHEKGVGLSVCCLHRRNPKSNAALYLPDSRHAHKRVISNAKVLLTTPTERKCCLLENQKEDQGWSPIRFVIESSMFMIQSHCERRIKWQSRFWLAIRGQPTALTYHATVDVRQLCWGEAPTSVPCNLQMNQRTQFREGKWSRIFHFALFCCWGAHLKYRSYSHRHSHLFSPICLMKSGDLISGDRTRHSATVSWYIYHCATDDCIKRLILSSVL